MVELSVTGRVSCPQVLAVATATLVARTIELRSIYEARLSDEEIEARQNQEQN